MGFLRNLPDEDGQNISESLDSSQVKGPKPETNLPGPPPDPSRIPSVVRTVGDLDLEDAVSGLGTSKQSDPDISALEEFVSEVEPPEPLSNPLSADPHAEAWLQLILTMVVREHGHTSLSISDIQRLIGERVGKGEVELKVFLDRLWRIGKLERIHGGAEDHYSPNPSWLESH
tara:strand:+ start:501 stop:1019 length:519 start_codon:yes stop_codon:yes gene_type:complete